VPQLQKKGLEFCDAEQGRIRSRDSDWEIKADNCGSSFSNLVLYPIDESMVIANQGWSVHSVAVAL
jgi:hypothetical protein